MRSLNSQFTIADVDLSESEMQDNILRRLQETLGPEASFRREPMPESPHIPSYTERLSGIARRLFRLEAS